MSILALNGSAILSGGGLLQSAPTSATVALTRPGTNPTNAVGEAIEFEAVNVTGLDVSGLTYTLDDAPLDQLVEWYWTITAPVGAATTWTAPTRLAPGHNARLKAYGRRGFIIPDVPGTWTFDVWGVDRSGATVEASASCEVVATSAVVADADSWVVYTDDLAGAGTADVDYDSTKTYGSWDAFVTALNASNSGGGGAIRVKVQGGATFTATSTISTRFSNARQVIIETYGSGRATVNHSTNYFFIDWYDQDNNVQINGIDVIPSWDATSESPFSTNDAMSFLATTGSQRAFSISNSSINNIGGNTAYTKRFAENVTFKDKAEYHALAQPYDSQGGGAIFLRGCNFDMPAASLAGGRRNADIEDDTRRNAHGNLRGKSYAVIDGCTFFTPNGWTYTSDGQWPAAQSCLRFQWQEGGLTPAGRLNIQRCVFEPGVGFGNASNRVPSNVLMERSIVLGHHQVLLSSDRGAGIILVLDSGVTIRNCQFAGASAGRTPGAESGAFKIHLDSNVTTYTGNTDPVRFINNTGVDLISGARTLVLVDVEEAFSQQEVANNLGYAPNYDTPHQPDGALVAETGTTPVNTGSRLGYTHHEFTLASDLAVGATSAVFPWFNDVDGVAVDNTTFSGSDGKDCIFNGGGTGYWFNFATTGDGVTGIVINKTAGGWSITNNLSTGRTTSGFIESGVLKAGTYYLQLDRRHDPVVYSGTASGVNDGQLWAPASAVTPDNLALVPYYDFKGNVRSSGSPTKGAIDPNGT